SDFRGPSAPKPEKEEIEFDRWVARPRPRTTSTPAPPPALGFRLRFLLPCGELAAEERVTCTVEKGEGNRDRERASRYEKEQLLPTALHRWFRSSDQDHRPAFRQAEGF